MAERYNEGARSLKKGALIITLIVLPVVMSSAQSDPLLVYDPQPMDPWLPAAVNLLVGVGIGSFIQGNTLGGVGAAAGEMAGIVWALTDVAQLNSCWEKYGQFSSECNSNGGATFGLGIAAVARIASVVLAFTYADSHNQRLVMSRGATVMVGPTLTGLELTVRVPLTDNSIYY